MDWLRRHIFAVVGAVGFIPALWRGFKWLLSWGEHIEFIAQHVRELRIMLDTWPQIPDWVVFPLLFGGLALIWWDTRRQNKSTNSQQSSYLRGEDSELSSAIRDMVWCSAWAKWFSAQSLANNHRPIDECTLLNLASSLVRDAMMDGKLEVRGRPPGAIEYESIPKETWRLAVLDAEPDPRSLWKFVIRPCTGVDPERISKVRKYDSLIVNSQKFETLWPRVDKDTDADRNRLLKKAKKAGADPDEIMKIVR